MSNSLKGLVWVLGVSIPVLLASFIGIYIQYNNDSREAQYKLTQKVKQIEQNQLHRLNFLDKERQEHIIMVEDELIEEMFRCFETKFFELTGEHELNPPEAEKIILTCTDSISYQSYHTYIRNGLNAFEIALIHKIEGDIHKIYYDQFAKDYMVEYLFLENGARGYRIRQLMSRGAKTYKESFRAILEDEVSFYKRVR